MCYYDNENTNSWTTTEYENCISIDDYIEVYGPDNEEFECEFMKNKQERLNDSYFEGLCDKQEGMNQYKNGYNAAKNFVMKNFSEDRFIKFQKLHNYTQNDSYWYNLGYMDGYNYYSNLVNESEIYEKSDDEKIMEDAYTKRLFSSRI